ncbi:palmitoyltransferase ZDHHC13 isoform X2 [Kogia breviceps]|uniref:palmitoyltransferase ZDHHC13 isoform X2 n=1 Tax=Kogia breviceps TaxID=27615 RepID=UPI002795320A|nr:palmitoyltransferase ZDHHC13 [Kogia breviceps]
MRTGGHLRGRAVRSLGRWLLAPVVGGSGTEPLRADSQIASLGARKSRPQSRRRQGLAISMPIDGSGLKRQPRWRRGHEQEVRVEAARDRLAGGQLPPLCRVAAATAEMEGPVLGSQCRNHSHGPHPPGFGRQEVCAHENKELAKAREALPLIEDSSNCDIVKATQYGIFERCKELVEAGYDVRQPDKENVSLLHWAAINNRLDLVKFYISKGAVVDQLGGDLNSTPLHWAIRQGHLPMVILLLQYGADPTLIDGEGFSSIHLAVLFQHMPVIAYLISKGQSVNMTDVNGQTPLMLSAHKVLGPEPTGFLLKFNPSLNVVDKIHQNTPLHWAIAAGNVNAIDKLLEAGASLDIRNVKGETPLDMALQNKNRLIIHMLKTEAKMRANKNFRLWRWLQKCELFLLLMLSVITMWAVGYILDFNSDSWLLKGFLLIVLLFLTSLFPRFLVGYKSLMYLPTVFLLSSVFWIFVTWFILFVPDLAGTTFYFIFILSIVAFLYFFYKTWATDPGFTKASEEERKMNIITLAETGCLDFRTFCTSCLIRKPLRSLHCHVCNSCVARYDQHCLWTGRCIGFGNHHYYIFFLFFLSIVCDWIIYESFIYWSNHCVTTFKADGLWTYLNQIVACSPWVVYIFTLASFHFSWSTFLLLNQLFQIAFLGLTSHERTSLLKQSRHMKQTLSLRRTPYNLGFIQNLADFFQCGCFGLVKPCAVDWTSQYTMVFHPAKEKVLRSV